MAITYSTDTAFHTKPKACYAQHNNSFLIKNRLCSTCLLYRMICLNIMVTPVL